MASQPLPEQTPELKLMSVRAARRGKDGIRRYNQSNNRREMMFDLGDSFEAETVACTKPEGLASAFGMLEALEEAKPKYGGTFRCLYIFHAEGTKFCKIGVSVNPIRRVADIQSANPVPVSLYACVFSPVMKAGSLEQKVLQEALEDGVRAEGEWIRATPQDALERVFRLAKRECMPICDASTWFENMRNDVLRHAAMKRMARKSMRF